jgi:ESX secretion system ATPase EccB
MAATPTTKSQVQAYRFVLKRMESALVRRDAVMLHDPMRTHLRAGIVGLCLALVAVAGVFIFGFFKPREALGTKDEILIGAESGATYVHVNNPTSRLIPVTNLASARLILVKQAGASGIGNAATATPRKVSDDILKDVPREPLAGIPGAPMDIPRADELVDPKWSLCDTTVVDPALPANSQLEKAKITTTAVIGLDRMGHQLGDGEALLVRSAKNLKYYLVYRGKRAEVNLKNAAVALALNLAADQAERRPVSNGLLNAIPEVPALNPPDIPNRGRQLNGYQVMDHQVGDVVRTDRAEGEKFYVLLRSGRQEITRSVANLIMAENRNTITIPAVPLGTITEAPEAAAADKISINDYPADVPTVVPVQRSVLACLYWSFHDGKPETAITIGDQLALPQGQQPVKLAQFDGNGEHLDYVFLPAGKGASVRGVVPDQPAGTGTIYLVTDLGTKYGVPSVPPDVSSMQLAEALGLGDFKPAPEAILRLLPKGAALDPNAVRSYDAVPVPKNAGVPLPEPGPGSQSPPAQEQGGDEGTTQDGLGGDLPGSG